MICVECLHPVDSLYIEYSPTNIRMTVCSNCGQFADKYIEHDAVVIAIDLLLLKRQAFRHMVFNVLSNSDKDTLHPQTIRMWILITLFDVYLTWAKAEKSNPTGHKDYKSSSSYAHVLELPVLTQYMIFLMYCVIDSAVIHIVIRILTKRILGWSRPNALSTAVLIASSSKLFPILMLIWPYDVPVVTKSISWAVNFNIVEVLTTILSCSYLHALFITACAVACKTAVCDFALTATIKAIY